MLDGVSLFVLSVKSYFYTVFCVITRFWDLAYPERSYIVAGGANEPLHCPSVLYSRKIIEGTEVVQVCPDRMVAGCSQCIPLSTWSYNEVFNTSFLSPGEQFMCSVINMNE